MMDDVTFLPAASTEVPISRLPASEGSKFGEYVILREIARGGMGVVYLARHPHLDREVAIKTLLFESDIDSPSKERFAVEAQAVARLDHPGIITIYEVGEAHGQPFLAMKFIDGGSLAKLLYQGPLACARALEIAIEVASAMAHAHQRSVIHRDLKPANILLDQAGQAIVTDFGVAKLMEASRCQLTTAGEPIGTPHYMPPEQADASRGSISTASDVYSLGAVMYAMLTGRPPFQAASAIDVMMQVLSSDPVPPKRLNSTVDATLDAIVMRCLQKEPRKRYPSAAELAEDLRRFRDGKPTIAKPVRGIRRAIYYLRKHILVATVSGSFVSLLLLTTLLVVISHVKLINQKLELENSITDLTDLLNSERNLFRIRLARRQGEEINEAGLIAERLASYSSYIGKQNPDLAVRLAVESVKQSQKGGQEAQPTAISTIQAYLAKQDSDQLEITDSHGSAEINIAELTSSAEANLKYQLTPSQKVLLGIEKAATNGEQNFSSVSE
jgi:serine/threonine protein kinase